MPPELAEDAAKSLHCREAAEPLRKRLWYDYAIGDNVEDPPEMDGRNGFSEFSVACAKLQIPLLRYELRGDRMEPMPSVLTDRRRGRVRAPKSPIVRSLIYLRCVTKTAITRSTPCAVASSSADGGISWVSIKGTANAVIRSARALIAGTGETGRSGTPTCTKTALGPSSFASSGRPGWAKPGGMPGVI